MMEQISHFKAVWSVNGAQADDEQNKTVKEHVCMHPRLSFSSRLVVVVSTVAYWGWASRPSG